MKKYLVLFIASTLVMSCGGNTENNNNNSTDTLQVEHNDSSSLKPQSIVVDVDNMLQTNFSETAKLPYKIGDEFYENLPLEANILATDFVKFLSQNFVETDLSYSGLSSIQDVVFFDSLKLAEEYESYCEMLDIGMMKDATAHSICQLSMDESTTLLIWFVDFATYEACPYFAGKTVYASVLKNNQIVSCTLIGEDSGGGDAPYWSENLIESTISTNNVKSVKYDRSGGETDEEGNEIVDESETAYELILSADGMWSLKNE